MAKQKTSKREKYEIYNDSWIYILLLTTLVILMDSLKTYTFQIDKISLTYAIFLLPLTYFITNYITKKYGSKRSIVAIASSGVGMVLFVTIMNFVLGRSLSFGPISGQFCGYVVSQFINLTIYSFLLENTNTPIFLIFLNYMFALIVFYMLYTLIYLNLIISDDFWISYFTVLLIQSIICMALAWIDKKVKKGQALAE